MHSASRELCQGVGTGVGRDHGVRFPPWKVTLRPKNNNNSDITSPGFPYPYAFVNSPCTVNCPLLLSESSIFCYDPD